MTNSVPGFVLCQGASVTDWVERDDRLPSDNHASSYDERNQQDWWEQNKKIRELFNDVKNQIHLLLNAGERVSVRMVSWSQLANRLSCDRATLKHPRRYHWVNAQRVQLLTVIENAKQQKHLSLETIQPEVSELEQLKQRLSAQRTQTGLWYDRSICLEQEVHQLRRLLAIRDAKIKELLATDYNRNQHLAN